MRLRWSGIKQDPYQNKERQKSSNSCHDSKDKTPVSEFIGENDADRDARKHEQSIVPRRGFEHFTASGTAKGGHPDSGLTGSRAKSCFANGTLHGIPRQAGLDQYIVSTIARAEPSPSGCLALDLLSHRD